MQRAAWSLFLLSWLGPLSGGAAMADEPAKLTFEQHVRPLLKVHCVHCHGDGQKEAGLDLRLRRWMVEGGDSGAAIEPGKPGSSLLYQRLVAGEMPPGDKKLSAAEIARIGSWISQGAPTAHPEPQQLAGREAFTPDEREFWSFRPPRRPVVPVVKQTRRVRTPIDAFIAEKLEAQKLSFSPDADRRTLLRRACFDLLGLPPSPGELEAFLADRSPDAYEKLIDRLLARPEYGERWGRHWLDVAGYADSDGYTPQDPVREYAYKYRDYVIRAFNADKPLDEFLREQLAGDEMVTQPAKNLRPDEVDKLIATGFLRMAPDGTGIDNQELARNHVLTDTVKIVSTSLLGLTLSCAECHSHKYDPIPQADYYRFRAIFEPALDPKHWKPPRARLVSLATDADRRQAQAIEAEAAQIDRQRLDLQKSLIGRTFAEELAKLPKDVQASLRTAFDTPADKRTADQKKLLQENPSVNVTAGSLYLYDRPHEAAVRAAEKKRAEREKELVRTVLEKQLKTAPAEQHAALRIAVKGGSLEKYDPAAAKELAALDAEIERLRSRVATEALNKLSQQATDVRARKPKEDFVHALTEPGGKLPATRVFYRGDYTQPRETVEPGEPLILTSDRSEAIALDDAKLPSSGRRLALARQLTDGTHPLVGRVLVNRIWLEHFGRGIVATPADFGMLGERPSHPELLDWLATELTEGGWRLKRLHKLIMTSTVYRQSSRRLPASEAVDPDNRLLSRMNVRRAEAEVLRDSILATSGRLNHEQFGPPLPVMPDDVGQIVVGVDTRDTAGRPTGKVVSLGDAVYRRSIYIQVRRTMPLSMLETFDAPTMTSSCNCEARSSSTVAPQSLLLMNNQFLLEQAGEFARRLRGSTSGLEDQIALAWKLALLRRPERRELDAALEFVHEQTAAFRTPGSKSGAASAAELRALTNLCQALLSSNEFLYVD
jgi:mono/diheme cytochrome c family protein